MEINRPMATEHARPLLLSLIMMTALSLVPMLSHAAVFWDDEMEQGNSGFSPEYMESTLIPQGVMAYDTAVKFSGSGSVRLNYPPECEGATFGGAGCGGASTRTVPLTENLYRRVYFRMSGQGPNKTGSGVFETSINTFTKMLRTLSDGLSREWFEMGCCKSKAFLAALENVPVGLATNVFTNITLTDNRWYCIETHEQFNTPGLANGILESWVDGVKVLSRADIMFRQAGNTNQWASVGIFRQTGRGNIWWDRYAVGNTRIGCLGGTSTSDTTPPALPQGLVIR